MNESTMPPIRTPLSAPISEDDLHAWVDEALPDDDARARVAAFLATDSGAATRVKAWQAERQRLRAALAPIVSEALPTQLNLHSMLALQHHGWRAWPGWAASVAAALLVCLGGLAGSIGGWTLHAAWRGPVATGSVATASASTADLTALARDAAASYRVYASDRIRPVELRAQDRALLTAWASARTGHAIAIPDLTDAGYRFMGGRVLATAHGAAVLYMYDDDQDSRLVMLARPMPDSANSNMTPLTMDALRGFAWTDDGLGYSLVGAAPTQTLHPLANEARRQLRLGV